MPKLLSLIALTPLLAAGGIIAAATPAQACYVKCTVKYQTYKVPDPTRRGNYVSHFDANGTAQSIVTASETEVNCPEVNGYQP